MSLPVRIAGPVIRRTRDAARPDGLTGLSAAVWVALAALVLAPLAAVVFLAVSRPQLAVLAEPEVLEAGVNSFTSATLSALLAVAAGTALAILIERSDLPARRALRLFALSPLLVPPFVGAIAWLGIAGPASPLNLWWRGITGQPLWSVYGGDGVVILLAIHSCPSRCSSSRRRCGAFRPTSSRPRGSPGPGPCARSRP